MKVIPKFVLKTIYTKIPSINYNKQRRNNRVINSNRWLKLVSEILMRNKIFTYAQRIISQIA